MSGVVDYATSLWNACQPNRRADTASSFRMHTGNVVVPEIPHTHRRHDDDDGDNGDNGNTTTTCVCSMQTRCKARERSVRTGERDGKAHD